MVLNYLQMKNEIHTLENKFGINFHTEGQKDKGIVSSSIALRCKDNIIFGRSTTYIAEPVEPGEPGDK